MSISYDIGLLANRPIRDIADIVAHAEERGFHGAWIVDSQSVFRDGYVALTAAAARTSMIRLASGVTNPVTRHPAVIASTFATLDEYSGGRAALGIGVGESAVFTIGARPAKLARLEQFVHWLRALTRGEEVEIDGAKNRLVWSRREVPIVIASSGPRSLQLAGRVADGVLFQVGADPGLAAWAIENVHRGAAEARRSMEGFKIYCRIATSVADDRDWAREQARGYVSAAAKTTFSAVPSELIPDAVSQDLEQMRRAYDYFAHTNAKGRQGELVTDPIIDAISVSGTPDEALPRFQELIRLGVQGFVFVTTGSDPIASMDALASSVIPRLNAPVTQGAGG